MKGATTQKQRLNSRWFFLLTLHLSVFWFSASYAKPDSQKYTPDDSSYFHALERGYAALSKTKAKSSLVKKSLSSLNRDFKIATRTGDHGTAILLLALNINLLEASLDSPKVMEYLDYLLAQEALPIANKLLEAAERQGDTYALSRMHYSLADYFYHLGRWEQAQKHLTSIEIRAALTKPQSDYATIIFGVTLQHQKKHRDALKYYDKITPESPYYGFAQLNTAVVFIRQGWWTDAKMAIDTALNKKASLNSEEFTNRLYLVLGYNQLQHEFYRNARESFRKITLDSQYANRALLGIGLCALNQNDYIGAINAFGILKGKKQTDVSIAESYLLYAFTHEQMSQTDIASAMYEEAIAYYDRRLRETDATLKMLRTPHPLDSGLIAPLSENYHIVPDYITTREDRLNYLVNNVTQVKTKAVIHKALQNLQSTKQALAIQAFTQEKSILVSYLSQAQFGQAKLFDNIQ